MSFLDTLASQTGSMAPFGQVTLSLAFVTAAAGLVFGAVGAAKRNPRLTDAALQTVYLFCGLISAATLMLVYSMYTHDFSLKYVQQYTDATQPDLYLITALWGGQAGSLLFWTFLLGIYGAASFGANRDRLRPILPHSVAVFMGIALFFVAILLVKANPFEMQRLGETPTDGSGLNPLLQTPLMAIHPPSLYGGYVGYAIPFVFAMGALLAGRVDADWIRATRKSTLVAFTFLSVGNILGSWWAYEELGWGGFWAWDPVETAAFFPWLTGTAFLHSVMIQERRGMFKVWNVALVALTFFLTVLGTTLTRSGIVESVHAFANSRIGSWFLAFLIATAVFSVGLIIYRWRMLRENAKEGQFHVLSREFSFLAQNVILTVMAIALVGFVLTPVFTKDIWPLIQEYVLGRAGDEITRSEATLSLRFYNQMMAPLGLALLFLMGVGPLIAWRKATSKNLIESFLWPIVFGVVATVVSYFLGIQHWFPLVTFGISAFTTATIWQEFWQGTRLRMRKGEGFASAFVNLTLKGKRRYGGYIVHLGIVAVFLGIAGAFYQGQRSFAGVKVERRPAEVANESYDWNRDIATTGEPGDHWKTSFEFGQYSFHYYDMRQEDTDHATEFRAYLAIKRDGEPFGIYVPGRNFYRTHPEQPTSEIYVTTGILSDLYVVNGGFDEGTGDAVFTVTINPLVFWMWLGMFLILGGSGICMAPEFKFVQLRAGAVATAMLTGLLLFLLAPAAMAAPAPALPAAPSAPSAPAELGLLSTALLGQTQVTQSITYPAVVESAAQRVKCHCGCPHLVSQCTLGECSYGPEVKDEMTKLVAQGYGEEQLVDWYVKKYGSKFLVTTPTQGLGPTLKIVTAVIALLGLGVLAYLALVLPKRRQQAAAASGTAATADASASKSVLSEEEEKKLAEDLARLE